VSGATSIDLNADVGEGGGYDEELVPLVTSVNIACGAHAGDLDAMRRTVALALRSGSAIGAHPGFADREHFGRREIPIEPDSAKALIVGQVAALEAVASALGARISHVKLHGALYNMASRDRALAAAVVDALMEGTPRSGPARMLVALAGSELHALARSRGLRVLGEAFADRSYRSDGTLTPRSAPGAVIGDEDAAVRQALRLAAEGSVRAADGTVVAVDADTICLHGDSPHSVQFAQRIRAAFAKAKIEVRRPS
jgi:5-oxoprolinase (ATP-hydrolysing) subunit A